MNFTNDTSITYDYQKRELNLSYAICEIIVAVLAIAGNALVIFVFHKEKRLRRRTNYYIVSLATADFLVGLLGIPFAIMSSVGLPNDLHACLFTVSLLVVLCTISIFCLVAVSVDRYWAILHPMGYSRNVRTRTALVIISICWFAGFIIGFLPLMGWHRVPNPDNPGCFFLTVMDYNYLVFLYFGTIITPALILGGFYAHIYRVVLKQLRQIVIMNPTENGSKKRNKKNLSSGGMIRLLGVQQRNEVRATQNLAIIVLFFMICWIPLYTVNCIIAFCKDFQVNSTFMLACIILSHLNSAGNPLLYAYHLRDFRAALKNFFCNIFHLEQHCDQFSTRQISNYSQYRNFSMNNMDFQKKKASILPDAKVSKIVKSSAVLAAAPATKIDRSIWNIVEDSGRDSASSQDDSIKDSTDSNMDNKCLMMMPYKLKLLHDLNYHNHHQQPFGETTSLDDTDDLFIDEESSNVHYNNIQETCLSDSVIKPLTTNPNNLNTDSNNSWSSSSPQLTRSVFVVENEMKKQNDIKKYQTLNIESTSISTGLLRKLSPYKFVNIFKNKRKLKRSLSDADGGSGDNHLAGSSNDLKSVIVADFCSVPI